MGLPLSFERRMIMIEEVCPKCGGQLIFKTIATYPPIPAAHCTKCDWCWEGTREKTVKVPFNPDRHRNDISLTDECNGINTMEDTDGGIFT